MGIKSGNKRSRDLTTHNSECSLPDKLSQALRVLRSTNASGSPFRNKNTNSVVEADDVIYYANSSQSNAKRYIQKFKQQTDARSLFATRDPPGIYSGQSLSSLDEIRSLYKSVPNINTLSNDSTFNKSPTDSGYRSASRHLNSSSLMKSGEKPNSSLNKYQNENHSEVNNTKNIHKPTIVVVNNDSSDHSLDNEMNVNARCTRKEILQDIGCHNSLASSSLLGTRCFTINECHQTSFGEPPIGPSDIEKMLTRGRCKGLIIDPIHYARIITLVARELARIAQEINRLSSVLGKCTQRDIKTAVKVVVSSKRAEKCIEAGVQATSIYALSGTDSLRSSMSRRAGLNLHLGRFYKWMIENRISEAICDESAVFLCAVAECLLEEFMLKHQQVHDQNGILKSNTCSMDETKRINDLSFNDNEQDLLYNSFEKTIGTEYLFKYCVENEEELIKTIQIYLKSKIYRMKSSKNEFVAPIFTKIALHTLLYFTKCRKDLNCCGCLNTTISSVQSKYSLPTLGDWIYTSIVFSDHRSTSVIDDDDIRQAARILLPNTDCPPRSFAYSPGLFTNKIDYSDQARLKREIGFELLRCANMDIVEHAMGLIGPIRYRTFSENGLSALSEAILIGNDDIVAMLLSSGADPNIAVTTNPESKTASALATDFPGWTPLSWAVLRQNLKVVDQLLQAGADAEHPSMVKETPLQLAAMNGNLRIAIRLINMGADPFRSSINYDTLKCDYRTMGSPSALAIVAARGERQAIRAMLSTAASFRRTEEIISLNDFLNESSGRKKNKSTSNKNSKKAVAFFDGLNKEQKKALKEALYYSLETSHIDIAMDLRSLGVPWNLHTFTVCLYSACEQRTFEVVNTILQDFNSSLYEELSYGTFDEIISTLLEVLRLSCEVSQVNSKLTANKIGEIFNRFYNGTNEDSPNEISECHSHRPVIDLKFVNNPQLSDVCFLVENKPVYSHRLVLINSSNSLKKLLETSRDQIVIDDVSQRSFTLLMEYLYYGGYSTELINRKLEDQMELMRAAKKFDVHSLIKDAVPIIKSKIACNNIINVYIFAAELKLESLSRYCEIFILKNVSSLIENDEFIEILRGSKNFADINICADLAACLTSVFYLNCKR